MRPIRTYGEAARRMSGAAQFWIGLAGRTESDEVREYARAMAARAIRLVEATEATPDRPFGERRVGLQCAAGCGAMVWESAARVWAAGHGGAPLRQRRCAECQGGTEHRPSREVPVSEATGPVDGARVEACLAEIVGLDRELFREWIDPADLASAACGEFEVLARRWDASQSDLVGMLGEDEARRRLWAARERAGTAAMVRPARDPDPVIGDPPAENSRTGLDDKKASASLAESGDVSQHDDEPPPKGSDWVF